MKHIDEDYTISFYKNASKEFETRYPVSITQTQVTQQTVTESVVTSYTYIASTGSNYDEWEIISGSHEISQINPNNSNTTVTGTPELGHRVQINNGKIYSNFLLESIAAIDNGIAIYSSSSYGYSLSDYINIPTASFGSPAYQPGYYVQEFSVDGNYLITPIEAVNQYYGGILLIYKSSSASGWQLETVLNSGSYDDAAPIPDGGTTFKNHNYYNCVIKGNLIFTNGFRNGTHDKYVAFFRSGSSGWEFEDQVQVAGLTSGESGNTSTASGRIGNSSSNFDFDGETGVVGSLHARDYSSSPYNDNGDDSSGRIYIIKSGSAGWYRETKLGLEDLGLTQSATDFGFPGNQFGGQPEEWYTWMRFGLASCTVSGSYIAATAIPRSIYDSGTSKHYWRRNSVFIIKSGSDGYNIEARLDDPGSYGPLSGSQARSDVGPTAFGYGITFGNNSLIVNSPLWEADPDVFNGPSHLHVNQGRTYVFLSKSVGGWQLDQAIDNPYSGSIFHKAYPPSNKYMGGSQNPNNSGAPHASSKTAISGSLIAIPAPAFRKHPDPHGFTLTHESETANYSTIYGGVIVLDGSGSLDQVEFQQNVTESVTTTSFVESADSPVPFRHGGAKGAHNLRNQSLSGHYDSYKP